MRTAATNKPMMIPVVVAADMLSSSSPSSSSGLVGSTTLTESMPVTVGTAASIPDSKDSDSSKSVINNVNSLADELEVDDKDT